MGQLDSTIFGGKTFSDILEEIYNNQKRRDAQVVALISELKPLIEDVGDATLVVPMIKEYLEIGVKNDDQLVKIATIVQRLETSMQKSTGGESDWLDSAELQALLEENDVIEEKIESVQKELDEEEDEDGL